MGYRVGIDVGERSVGFAAVRYDEEGVPAEILAAVSHIHDGGMDPDTAKSPTSRLATSGVARRTRRLLRNRRKRLKRLDETLVALGQPVPHAEVRQTFEAWNARADLARARVSDHDERMGKIVLAVRHIARHRGWRNPWWSYARLLEASTNESPSQNLMKIMEEAAARGVPDIARDSTLGEIVSSAGAGARIRDTVRSRIADGGGALLVAQVRQEDSLAELRRLLHVQGMSTEDSDVICQAVFAQAKPRIPRERIGKCALMPGEFRAPISSLEFQEFRVRAAVANLRLRRPVRSLTPEEHDLVVGRLLDWREGDRPRWADVSDMLGLPLGVLALPTVDDDVGVSQAPFDQTSCVIEQTFKKTSMVGAWWRDANRQEQSALVDAITDLSADGSELEMESVATLLEAVDAVTRQKLDELRLSAGRAAYCREALEKLNLEMRQSRCDAHTARQRVFGVSADWQPPRPSLEDPVEHPTVSRVNVLVRRFMSTACMRWGVPDRVVVEHVRGAFLGPAALAEQKRLMEGNRERRERTRHELEIQGISRPSATDVRRYECVERQNSVCLYCGTSIGMTTSELDHIVARAAGGSGRRDNLVAVCRPCNAEKGRDAFVAFAQRTKREGVSLDEARARVRDWQCGRDSVRQFAALKRDVVARLALQADDEIDERAVASTAYAAREMRFRIETSLEREALRAGSVVKSEVSVFSGGITSEARRAGGIDELLRLHPGSGKRFDRRHHALDAAVLTTLRPAVATVLHERRGLRRDFLDKMAHDEPSEASDRTPQWKRYEGRDFSSRELYAQWKVSISRLGELLQKEISSDRIPVVRPLRLAPRIGALHADTIEALMHRDVSAELSGDEVRRICDPELYTALSLQIGTQHSLPPDPKRASRLGLAPGDHLVKLFPSNAAYLALRGGAAKIGDTARFARVFAWPDRHGHMSFGMIRLYAGEFGKIGFSDPGVDILRAALPAHSQSLRTANPHLVRRIQRGEAREIGWITLGDEIELSIAAHERGDGKLGEFLRAMPEARWTLTGFFDSTKVSIAPRLLAGEGLPDEAPAIVRDVLRANRIPIAVNVLLGSPDCQIIRRTVLGRPRWEPQGGLPASWNPRAAAERAFAE